MKYLAFLALMNGKIPEESSEFSENFEQKLKNFAKKQPHCEKCSQDYYSDRAAALRANVRKFRRLHSCGCNANAMRMQCKRNANAML